MFFSINKSSIFENIIKTDSSNNWYKLIDKESGNLKQFILKTISSKCANMDINDLFSEIINMRNRIIRGLRITAKNGE